MKLESVLRYLLPSEILEYFDLVKIEESSTGELLFCLDEKLQKPSEHSDKELLSKGFDAPVLIQDFPLRDRAVYWSQK